MLRQKDVKLYSVNILVPWVHFYSAGIFMRGLVSVYARFLRASMRGSCASLCAEASGLGKLLQKQASVHLPLRSSGRVRNSPAKLPPVAKRYDFRCISTSYHFHVLSCITKGVCGKPYRKRCVVAAWSERSAQTDKSAEILVWKAFGPASQGAYSCDICAEKQ